MSTKAISGKKLSTSNTSVMPIALYNSQQVYAMEQDWFAQGYDSFALMQQAAWQMTQRIIELESTKNSGLDSELVSNDHYHHRIKAQSLRTSKRVILWVGQGNNGGDGWLIALYLQQAGWQVKVITVGIEDIEEVNNNNKAEDNSEIAVSAQSDDATKARHMALAADCPYVRFEDNEFSADSLLNADIYIDAIFGIGLDRAPEGAYKQAITTFNQLAKQADALVAAVDIPSGLVAATGQVFEGLAIKADVSLCLVARKLGLHTKDGMDYAGTVIDLPLIPIKPTLPSATLLSTAYALAPRQQNSYKGSYGHVLVIGGNRIDGSQGMGGAAILSASSAMATGAGKITVACHDAFHGALLTSLPDAMTVDLHDVDGVKSLIKEASVIAIGMGLGRDEKAKDLFINYIQAIISAEKAVVIDADGLYHLATLQKENHPLIKELKAHSKKQKVYLTPHSGEAARLLDTDITKIEADRISSIKQCADSYGGDWVLKGAGSLILEQGLGQQGLESAIYICAVGNPGMATAGMGDVLSGVCAGLIAQQDLLDKQRSLAQAALIHGLAGDVLLDQLGGPTSNISRSALMVGQRGMQAQDMPAAVRHVMELLTQ